MKHSLFAVGGGIFTGAALLYFMGETGPALLAVTVGMAVLIAADNS